jgi:hypothetical protein
MSENILFAVAQVVLARQGRRVKAVLVDSVYAFPERPGYRVRVSCDEGKTWGWHNISRQELIERTS